MILEISKVHEIPVPDGHERVDLHVNHRFDRLALCGDRGCELYHQIIVLGWQINSKKVAVSHQTNQ
jgi:hypothetical protein